MFLPGPRLWVSGGKEEPSLGIKSTGPRYMGWHYVGFDIMLTRLSGNPHAKKIKYNVASASIKHFEERDTPNSNYTGFPQSKQRICNLNYKTYKETVYQEKESGNKRNSKIM